MRNNKSSTEAGFGHVLAVVLAVVVLGAVGYIGYMLYAKPADTTSTATTATSDTTASTELTAPNVTTASDLDKASSTLDQVDPSGSNQGDESALDSQLNAF